VESEKSYTRAGRDERNYSRRRTGERTRSGARVAEPDYLVRLIVVQSVVCAAALLVVFLVGKASPNSLKQIKERYDKIMLTDMTAGEVVAALKEMSGFVFLPADEWKTGANQEKTGAKADDDKSGVTGESEVESTGSADEQEQETQAAENTDETKQDGAGGEDETVSAASKNASFAPYYITASITTPLRGKLTSGFGYRVHPVTGVYGVHTGIDIAADEGEKIAAAFYGTVKETGVGKLSGKYIILEHKDGFETVYLHCSEIIAREGERIRQGETIALVGATGETTGPHLHFEIRINGIRCNPSRVISADDIQV